MAKVTVRAKLRDLLPIEVAYYVGQTMALQSNGIVFFGSVGGVLRDLFPNDIISPKLNDAVFRQLIKWGFRKQGYTWTPNLVALENYNMERPSRQQAAEANAQTEGGPVAVSWFCPLCGDTFESKEAKMAHKHERKLTGIAAAPYDKQVEAARHARSQRQGRPPMGLVRELVGVLAREGAMGSTDLAKKVGTTPGTVSHSIGKAVRMGLVQREFRTRKGGGRSITYSYLDPAPAKPVQAELPKFASAPARRRMRKQAHELIADQVLKVLIDHPWIGGYEIAKVIGTSSTTARKSARTLVARGLAQEVKRGHTFLFAPVAAGRSQLMDEAVDPGLVLGGGNGEEDGKIVRAKNGVFVWIDGELKRVVDA